MPNSKLFPLENIQLRHNPAGALFGWQKTAGTTAVRVEYDDDEMQ